MADKINNANEEVKSFVIDINVKYQFTGTESDIERLKNDKDYLQNVCNALQLNKRTDVDGKHGPSSVISVTAVNITNATPQDPRKCTKAEQPSSEALDVLATATELRQAYSLEPSVSHSMTTSPKIPPPDFSNTQETVPARLLSSSSLPVMATVKGQRLLSSASLPVMATVKGQTVLPSSKSSKKVIYVRSRPRPIAIKPLPPTIYGQPSIPGSTPFVPIILKPLSTPFTFVQQTPIVPNINSGATSKSTPCNQPMSYQTSEFLAHQKSFLSDQHTFRPVKSNEILLDLYEIHLDMFAESKYSRTSIWEKVAARMIEHGYSVTGSQCNNRWRYLLATFNKIATGDGDSNSFKYFNRIAEILHRKSIIPVLPKGTGIIVEAMVEAIGDGDEGKPLTKKRRRRKEDEKDELIANLSKKMEQLQEMQNEMSTFLSAFKDGVVKKQ